MKYPRALAVRTLTRVLSDFQSLDEVLVAEAADLDPEAVAWLYEVCSGTLRWKGRLDWMLDSLASRKKPSGWLRKILLLSAYQLVVQDRAPAAQVVSETVDEIKRKEGDAPAHFANACLRKIAAHAQEWRAWAYPVQADSSSPEVSTALTTQAAAWASLPPWMWNKLVHQRGLDWIQGFAQATLERPQLWIRSRDPQWQSDWVERGPVSSSWLSRPGRGGAVTRQAGFLEGHWIVQDISSQVLISEVTSLIRGAMGSAPVSALDLCAAPGGKSVGLAWSGFQVSATEFKSDRVPLLRDTIARAAPEIELLPWDQVISPAIHREWGLVWVDAPCSGSGIIRRHPDVRWLRKEQELVSLTQQQKKILRQGWDRVQPGGFLVYSVCSVFADEGERIVLDFIKEFELKSGHQVGVSIVRQWLLSPHEAPGGDGFFAALLQKSG